MNLNDLIDKTVILTILSAFPEKEQITNKPTLTDAPTFQILTKIVDQDNYGLWIEVKDYSYFDKESRTQKKTIAHVLVKYEFIASIIGFPEPNEGIERRIGFDVEE